MVVQYTWLFSMYSPVCVSNKRNKIDSFFQTITLHFLQRYNNYYLPPGHPYKILLIVCGDGEGWEKLRYVKKDLYFI